MTSMELLSTKFYRLNSRHAPTGVYRKWFDRPKDDKTGVVKGLYPGMIALLPPLQIVERPLNHILESTGEGERLESR